MPRIIPIKDFIQGMILEQQMLLLYKATNVVLEWMVIKHYD